MMASKSATTTEVTTTPNLELVFNKDNPSNCVLTPSSGSGPCYSAVAKLRDGKDMVTTYRKSQGSPTDDWESALIIAILEWREVFSDKLALAGRPPLFEKGGKEGIAGFKKSRLDHASGVVSPAVLTLSPRAVEIADLVVVSFLVLEKQRRMDDASSNNKADAFTSADIGVGNITGGNNIYKHGV
ncbi:hypothetical protein FRC10_003932 [Ceratobasidium sp. 414]|nr:hypothetical protein FRC10_003932 [Ceratobasidium sp. 414]